MVRRRLVLLANVAVELPSASFRIIFATHIFRKAFIRTLRPPPPNTASQSTTTKTAASQEAMPVVTPKPIKILSATYGVLEEEPARSVSDERGAPRR